MKINWIMVAAYTFCYWAGYSMALLMNRRRRNRTIVPYAFWRYADGLCYWLGECGARAGYAAAITCGVLLGIGAGLPLVVALGRIMRGIVP